MQDRDKTKRTGYELFSGSSSRDPKSHDLFSGKPPVHDSGSGTGPVKPEAGDFVKRPSGRWGGHFFWILALLTLNCFMVGGILSYLVVRKDRSGDSLPAAAVSEQAERVRKPSPAVEAPLPLIRKETVTAAELFESVQLSSVTVEALDRSVSLRSAESLYEAREYFKACYVYSRLRENLVVSDLGDECLDNYLELKMALCLQRTQEQELMTSLFSRAIESRSPVVRALAWYNLGFLQMHNRQYLAARTSAYKALALIDTFDASMPETIEADCYFLAAESLTRYLLKIHNETERLPGSLWSDRVTIHSVPILDQDSLRGFLVRGIEEINRASVSPKIDYLPYREAGAQWSAICSTAPLEEVLWKYSSSAQMNLTWARSESSVRNRPVTLYLPLTSGTYLAEVAAGSAGLLWRYDGQSAWLYDPESYEDFEAHKEALASEMIAIWQRYLLRYRGDHRAPNAHYSLGVMYSLAGQAPTALGEYRLISSQYPHNPLAPYALLHSSKLKTDLRDYEGARSDLSDLLMQYPDFRLVDEATLYLAEAALESGLYAESEKMFEKVYRINLSASARSRASYGLGQSAYKQGDYAKSQEWLTRAIEMMEETGDSRLGMSYSLLGRVCLEQGRYEQASMAYRAALRHKLSGEEYFQVTLSLIESRIREQRYVEALEILEGLPDSQLSQEQACEALLRRAQILREIDLTDSAVSLLRRKIEFIAEAGLRARLSVELGRCYLATGDLGIAEKELSDAVYDLESRGDIQQALILLAEIVYRRGRLEMAEELCRQILDYDTLEESVRGEVFVLLGRVYEDQQRYDQAALAYAGIVHPREEMRP